MGDSHELMIEYFHSLTLAASRKYRQSPMKKITSALILIILIVGHVFGQSKMVVGQKHTIFVDIPKNWLQARNEQLPFFIKPDKKGVSTETYIYVYGIDYNGTPELNGWIDGNNNYILDEFKDVEIDTLNQKFENLKANGYTTGNYRTISYVYPNGRNEVILVIECNNTIVTAVLSTKDKSESKELLPSFLELSKSLKILGTTLKE